jgi:hypothetical protein
LIGARDQSALCACPLQIASAAEAFVIRQSYREERRARQIEKLSYLLHAILAETGCRREAGNEDGGLRGRGIVKENPTLFLLTSSRPLDPIPHSPFHSLSCCFVEDDAGGDRRVEAFDGGAHGDTHGFVERV